MTANHERERTMRKRNSLAAAVLAAALGTAACGEGLTDINVNPNEPTVVAAEYLFTNAVEASISRAMGSTVTMDLTGLWIQHYAESRYTEEDRYELRDQTVQTQWAGFWAGPMQDFNEVVTKGAEAGRPNVEAMGVIMRSWTYQVITDLWGDIGYTDALRGRVPGSENTVAYDPQEQVYKGLVSELAAASAMLDPAGVRMGNADLLYQGDPVKWRRFANSLRLRLAMRMAAADETAARAAFAAGMAGGVMASNADNAVLRYVDNGVDVHPFFAYERNRDDHAISATMVDSLARHADPRLPLYAKLNAGGYYKGMANGTMADPPLDSISKIGAYFSRANAPAYVMTYAEVLFLQAEAVARGWIAGDAAALYRQAIRAHMEMLGIGSAAIDTYLAQPGVAYDGLRSIGVQKWIALYGNGPEAFAEWRRTGHPGLTAGPDALNDGRIPRRLPYPSSEQSLNAANVEAAKARQGGASLNSPVWWDRS
jgi:hypothetical protein